MPKHSPKMLHRNGVHLITLPKEVSICPECGDRLIVESTEWISESGLPTKDGLYVSCKSEERIRHRHWQSDWQSVVNVVQKWADAQDN